MARARNIKPGFFHNEDLAEASVTARLLFIGLWTIADFKGCIEYRPKRIKAALFPYDDVNLDELVSDLAKHGFLIRYTVGGKQYLKVPNFVKHQRPHKNEVDAGSDLPDDSEADAEVKETKGLEEKPDLIGTNRDKSGRIAPLPSSPIPSTESPLPMANAASPPEKPDPVETRIWRDGVDLLSRSGLSEQSARAFLGKQVKDFDRERLAQAIAITQARNPPEPKAFLIAVLQDRLGDKQRASGQIGKYDPTMETMYQPSPPCGFCGEQYCLKEHREAA